MEMRGKAFFISWRPLEEALNHRSIRVFLMHNGLKSTLESMSIGVLMICWPFSGDHILSEFATFVVIGS